jgi:hypothetical protein
VSADDPASLSADELERIGILLLWHQAAACGRRIRQFEESKLLGCEENQILRQAAHVDHRQCTGVQKRRDEITLACGVDAVPHYRREAEAFGQTLHVDGVTGAGNGARTERQLVALGQHVREPRMIATQRRRVGKEEMRREDGLRAPHVSVGRHERIARTLGLIDQDAD